MTYGDKIRSMTDEEIVQNYHKIMMGSCLVLKAGGDPKTDCKKLEFKNGLSPCQQCELEWLQQTVKEG